MILTECVDSSITGSYVELGIISHTSVELLLLEGAVEFVVFFVVTIAYLCEFTVSPIASRTSSLHVFNIPVKLSYSNNISKIGSEERRRKCLLNYNSSINPYRTNVENRVSS